MAEEEIKKDEEVVEPEVVDEDTKEIDEAVKKLNKGLKEFAMKKSGPGLCGWMFLIFMTLKLTNVINWSWWWITAPLWIPLGIVVSILTFIVLLVLIIAACTK